MALTAAVRIDSNGAGKIAGSRDSSPVLDADHPTHYEACAGRVGLIGRSVAHRRLLTELHRVAQVDAEVFLIGETGVGKELYARYVHECSPRSKGEFVAINCGAIPDALFENELFGHSAGAYTDAKTRSEGLVAAASGGTLFLDEVDGLSQGGQVKLLRLLQEKEYRRLGETRVRRADIRVISAMNRDPLQAVDAKELREDLFYRLYVTPKVIQPLRERPDDIDLLADQFVLRYCQEYTRSEGLDLTSGARRLLAAYHWPGNIRQLESVIRSLVCQHPNSSVQAEDLPILQPREAARASASEQRSTLLCLPFKEAKRMVVERFEVDYIREMLRRTQGNICQAARLAGKDRRAFFEVMRKHDINPDEFTNS